MLVSSFLIWLSGKKSIPISFLFFSFFFLESNQLEKVMSFNPYLPHIQKLDCGGLFCSFQLNLKASQEIGRASTLFAGRHFHYWLDLLLPVCQNILNMLYIKMLIIKAIAWCRLLLLFTAVSVWFGRVFYFSCGNSTSTEPCDLIFISLLVPTSSKHRV